MISRRVEMDTASSLLKEICLFITSVIVISAYGLPILLARNDIVSYDTYAVPYRCALLGIRH